MAAKFDFKDILLRKGEKVALVTGAVVAGLLLVLGVQTMASVGSPDATAKEFTSKAGSIKSQLQQPGEPAPELNKSLVQPPQAIRTIKATEFAPNGTVFEPVSTPDLLRHNPEVLGIIDGELGYVQGPMVALDIQENDNGPPSIGVLVTAQKTDAKLTDLNRVVTSVLRNRDISLQERAKKQRKAGPQGRPGAPQAQPGLRPGAPGAPAGFGPMGSGAGGPPPGMMQGGPGGMMPGGSGDAGMGGFNPANMYGDAMYGGDPGQLSGRRAGIDQTVKYMNPDEVRKNGFPLAETVYPIRMVVVQAAFPLKAQIEKIRQALRIPDPGRGGVATLTGTAGVPPAPGGAAYPPPGAGGPQLQPAPGGSSPMMQGMQGASGTPPYAMSGTAGAAGPSANVDPYFYGFEVERLVIPPGAPLPKEGDEWAGTPFDHEDEYFRKIRVRKVADQPDNPELFPFLRYDQRLAAPLPLMADRLAEYPRTTLKPIVDTIAKIKERLTPKEIEDEWKRRFQGSAGSDNPYAPFAQTAFSGGAGAMGSADAAPGGGLPGAAFMPGRAQGLSGAMTPPYPGAQGAPGMAQQFPGREGVAGADAAGQAALMPEIEHLLLRFVDTSVQPGSRYQYRVRVVMHNPNWVKGADDDRARQQLGLDKVLRRPADAGVQKLYGPWVKIPQILTVPPELFVYSFDAQEYLTRADELANAYGNEQALRRLTEEREVRNGQKAVIQIQKWMPKVRIDASNSEPVGSWVVSEVPVGRGEYLGKRQLVELPLWSAALKGYVLRELTGGVKVAGIKDPNNQPKGWPITFDLKSVLVDFDGGPARLSARGGLQELQDAADTEVLILRPDGKMLVRSSRADMGNEDRTARDTGWKEWVARSKQRKDVGVMAPGGDPMGAESFQRRSTGGP